MAGPNGVTGHWGNAYEWKDNAIRIGYAHDTSPTRGSVAWWPMSTSKSAGHVAYVDTVNTDGSITIEQYNIGNTGNYSTETIARGSSSWPPEFLHVGGEPSQSPPPPPPPADSDQDGVIDTQDQCPTVPGVLGNNGCPANKPNIVADVSGDGKADLLHIWSGGVNTWLANGNGTYTVANPFKPFADYSMTSGFDWKIGDFNGDGKSDLAHLWNGGVNTWLSNGNGTYTVANPFKPFADYTMSNNLDWEVGDFNGDGKSDLAHLWYGGVNTWLSNGDGTYTVANPYLPVSGYSMTGGIGWKVGDFNHDGKTDLLHIWSGGVNTWLSNGDGTYTVTNPYLPSGYSMTSTSSIDFKVGDFNGDGKTDLVHLWAGGMNTWLSNGDGTYAVTNPYLPSGYSMTSTSSIDWKIGDFNGDGKTDFLHLWTGGANTWLSNGNGTYTVTNPYLPVSGYSMTGGFEFTVGDTDHDGKADLLHLWGGGVNTWTSHGDGTYGLSGPYLPDPNYSMTGGPFYPSY